ncbi:MAG TPA: T9SS type A sorting domain-containing protein, partial [Bacteroidia bacterium]|nr:T9SS type A sorting domain-containing protein [Bacteroidia bacterium]
YSVNGSNWQTSNDFSNLDAGTYNVLVKDANGCVGEASVTITQPSAIVVTVVPTNVTCHLSYTGSATINAAGGAGTLAYCLDGETGWQSSNVFTNLPAGMYLALVRDAAGCVGYAYFNITEPSEIQMSAGVLNVQCNGGNSGAIYVNAAGGTGTLTYSIDGVNYQSGTVFNGLIAGTYIIYVKDANGCVAQQFVTVEEPHLLEVYAAISDVVCAGGNDGMIDATVFGGTYPYSFDWSNGATTEDNFNLVAGTHSVTVTDDNGCVTTQSYTVNQPANPIIVNGNVSNATGQSATDGGVDITVSGGTAPYTYQWSNGATTEDISGVAPGVYLVTITDASGCTTSDVYIVNFAIGIATHNANTDAISLYPNPAHGNFTIDAGTMVVDKLEVADMLGQIVYSVEPKTSKTQVNTEGLSEGIYFVHMYINGAVVTKRVEVSK